VIPVPGRTRAARSWTRGKRNGGRAPIYSVGPFTDANYLSAIGSGPDFGTNHTLDLTWFQSALPSHDEYPWAWVDGTTGWYIGFSSATGNMIVGMRGHPAAPTVYVLSAASVGLVHRLVAASDGTNLISSVDGGAVLRQSLGGGAYVPASGTAIHGVGRLYLTTWPSSSIHIVEARATYSLLTDAQIRARSQAVRRSFRSSADSIAARFLWTGADFTPAAGTSVSRGTNPVTFTVNGTLAKQTESNGSWTTIDLSTPAASAFFSSNAFSVTQTGTDGANYERHSAFARVSFLTNATRASIGFAGAMFAQAGAQFANIAVFVDGVYSTLVTAQVSDVTQEITISLPAGTKTVTLVDGAQGNPGHVVSPINCTAVTSFSVPPGSSLSLVAPTAPVNKIVVVGDSLSNGGNATVPGRDAWPVLLQSHRANTEVTVIGWGFAGIQEFYANHGNSLDWLADLIVAQCNGTGSNKVVIPLGTNDYGLPLCSAATFRTLVASLTTKIRARSTVPIVWIKPARRISPAVETANSFGNTLTDYRNGTDLGVADAGASSVTVADSYNWVSTGNYAADGIHFTTAGQAEFDVQVELLV
jgi:lysophospholipase L1-like esterase